MTPMIPMAGYFESTVHTPGKISAAIIVNFSAIIGGIALGIEVAKLYLLLQSNIPKVIKEIPKLFATIAVLAPNKKDTQCCFDKEKITKDSSQRAKVPQRF